MLDRISLAALASLGLAAAARADTYYTVDVTNDVLYKINVTTGVATMVGPIGADNLRAALPPAIEKALAN